MTPATPLLGFAVPTYRRPELLDRALASIVAEATPLAAPIFVSDNACDDTNREVVERWRRRYAGVSHRINATNLGIDGNVDQCIRECPSTWVHVIGDDDVLLPGFASAATRLLAEREWAHAVCSYMYLANDYRPITGKPIIGPSEAPTMRSFLPRFGWTLGFIGAHLFHRERFSASAADGIGSYYHHLVKLLSYLDPDEPIGFLAEPLVGNRADDESTATWSGDRLAVVFGLERALADAMRGRYDASEIAATIGQARASLGYRQSVRLLYWAALAERAGVAGHYWSSLAKLVPPAQHRMLASVPRALHGPLLGLVPLVRRLKRRIASKQVPAR